MAAVTATILLGGNHPNDVSVDPYFIMKLWEGDRAAWTVHSLEDPTFERRVLPQSPETIAVEGARMARGLVREFGLGAVMVCAIDGSSILQGIEEMATVITEVDLHLLTPAGSRTYSRWKDQWHTTGVLENRANNLCFPQG